MTTKSKCQGKKRLVYVVDPNALEDAYEFKYELTDAMDEIIESIKGLKRVVEVWLPLSFTDRLIEELTDEQDPGSLPV